MFRNYLAAALRNLARNRLYAGISIVGLAVGMCAALLSFLVIRNQLTFDRFVPGYERIYVPISVLAPPGRGADYRIETNSGLAQRLMLRFNDIEAATRLTDERVVLQRGETKGQETIYWADPNFLDVLALRVVAGDARTALKRPDGIVLPRSLARKYFGREDAVGSTLLVGKSHPMTVTAIIEDLPAHGTQLDTGILASGLASWSQLTTLDNAPPDGTKFSVNVRTYLRLARGASVERIQLAGRQIPETLAAIARLWAKTGGGSEPLQRFFLNDYIQDLYLTVLRVAQGFGVMACVAVLLACLGLIGLSSSTTERRTKEIGIRKAMGATRAEILRLMVWQFIKPVLWACLIAAPVSAYLMSRWLAGFAYHIDLTPWPFVGAVTLSLAIAVLTVSAHCYAVARAKPVAALRYE